MNEDVIVREVLLPPGVHGVIREDPDGLANIYINVADPEEEKKRTLRHELRHYRLRHLGSGLTLRHMESDADR